MEKGRKTLKTITAILLAFFLFVLTLFGVGWLGALFTGLSWEHWRPTYEKTDLTAVLEKTEWTDDDYQLLYRQTGLTEITVNELLSLGDKNRIIGIQTAFFAENNAIGTCFAPWSYVETIDGYVPLAPLQNGDILISAAAYVSFFRYGHAALVVDGAYGRILEALEPGTQSKITAASTFSTLANFIVLRPKVDKSIRDAVAKAALRDSVGVNYSLMAGLFGEKYQETLSSTHCSHLVWHAYMRYGIDLDGDGGNLVKPQDFLRSPLVDVVQVYGFDLDTLWG